jgi:regulatory protein
VDAYTTALHLLSRRELSTRQLRERLARRGCAEEQIDDTIARLRREGALDDRRVALAAARVEASIRRKGRRRVLQRVRQLGIDAAAAESAVDEVFRDVDEAALLESALERRLKGADVRALDDKAIARVVRALLGQGFAPAQVYARLRRKGRDPGG